MSLLQQTNKFINKLITLSLFVFLFSCTSTTDRMNIVSAVRDNLQENTQIYVGKSIDLYLSQGDVYRSGTLLAAKLLANGGYEYDFTYAYQGVLCDYSFITDKNRIIKALVEPTCRYFI
tara:strand:+ start:124 stop:480 length:357 start_codon:yes stop_codon:yes gene_type:complete